MGDTATPRHQRATKLGKFLFGVPYYPEHWTAADRQGDAAGMAGAGVNVVRMGEFAWDRLEPRPGQLDFSLFDETIAELGECGIDTIFCAPTATPPRWLTASHTDWFRVDENGRWMDHGSRQHCCTNNEAFRAESRRITAALAEHFRDNPRVIGWQTDNELNCHFSECYCASCQVGFRQWLRAKYGSIGALNAAWGTAFWAQTYRDFEQVPLPYPHGRPAYPNPSHELDYYRYLSDSTREFQRQQVQVLRQAKGEWFITHNGLFPHIDYWQFAEDLDFMGVDVYPGFAKDAPGAAAWASWLNERCRCVSGGYIVPEQQGGPGGQRPYLHRNPQPGRMRLWAYQSIAHGADGVLHFRWRTCRFGAEEYWCGILDHDNVPRRRYDEFAQEGRELARIGQRVLGTTLDVQAAVLTDFEQRDADETLPNGLPSCDDQGKVAYGELLRLHLPCGLVHTRDSFAGLKLLVLPSMKLMDELLAERLRAFVAGGGVLAVTARSATRNRDNQVVSDTPPGLLGELCGVGVEEFGVIEPGELTLRLGDVSLPSGQGYEVLSLRSAQAAARWAAPAGAGPWAAEEQVGVAIRAHGGGKAVYIGTYLTPQNVGALLGLALAEAKIAPLAQAAPHVEVMCRRSEGRRLTFVLNHYPQPQKIEGLPRGMELLAQRPCDGTLDLPAWGVGIVDDGNVKC